MSVNSNGFAIVDDTPRLAEMVGNMLRSAGYTDYQTFDDPRAALDAITSGKFSMVITDYNMPGMTGVELLNAAYEHNNQIKGLIMSANVESVKSNFDVLEKGREFQKNLIEYIKGVC